MKCSLGLAYKRRLIFNRKKNNNNKIIIINDNLNTRLAVIHTRYSVSGITHIHTNIHSHIN